jgi:uncharacterized protein YecT (DUF1311 family)
MVTEAVMTYARWLAVILAVTVSGPISASDRDDPVSRTADECLAKPEGQTVSGMTACSHQAFVAYDKEMNAIYRRVLHAVDPRSRELIREAQRRWLAYREAQQAADNGPWRAGRGSLADPDIEALNVDAVRDRIRELQYYAP